MRCNKCGRPNQPGATVCSNCGHLLSDSGPTYHYGAAVQQKAAEARPTIMVSDHGQVGGQPLPKKTIVQGAGEDPRSAAFTPKSTIVQGFSSDSCPVCHYPMTDNFCPRCGYIVPGSEEDVSQQQTAEQQSSLRKQQDVNLKELKVSCPHCKKEVSASFRYCPHCATPIPQETIDIFNMAGRSAAADETNPKPEIPPHFTLTPLVGQGGTEPDAITMELADGVIVLNRENTAPGNRTITSKEQARISLDEGLWIIENRSEYNSTFVAADRPIELQAGDIILLGDQRFRFNPVTE